MCMRDHDIGGSLHLRTKAFIVFMSSILLMSLAIVIPMKKLTI